MCRLCEHIASAQLQQRAVHHAPAFSAQRRAHYLKESGRRVVKSVLVESDSQQVLLLLPACAAIRGEVVSENLGEQQLRFVAADGIHRRFTDCEVGMVPGFGTPFGLPVLMDCSLRDEPYFLVPGWTSCLSYKLAPAEFEALETPRWLSFSDMPARRWPPLPHAGVNGA